ncbi:MAG: hypothetical protein PHQ58_04815 [Rhodoferax sp.]|uniref:hypothetical protein n=1 Tax=Rhodoferax sp. TaxID=50421 RepID=UPI00261B2B50|nr:hypothetical protein [Rhodoferax sp.]MDD2879735.1 hypothetical protein [Rhodoferax sp.]
MAKSALVIPAEQRFFHFENWTPSMVSRDICETDPTTLQVLPYVILVNEHNEVYMYTRGTAGDESRLHAKRSIGLGGHIDTLPVSISMEDHIVSETIREIEEECGYKASFDEVKQALSQHNRIYLTDTDVDAVHLGLAFPLRVKKSDITRPEAGTVINPQWVPLDELKHYIYMERLLKPQVLLWTMENWSKQAVSIMTVQNHLFNLSMQAEAEIARYRFYADIVTCMNKVGINAKLNAVRGLRVMIPMWADEDGNGEGYVAWSIENEERYKTVEQYLEGFVFSDGSGVGEVAVTPDFERWEVRDITTLHPLPAVDEAATANSPT